MPNVFHRLSAAVIITLLIALVALPAYADSMVVARVGSVPVTVFELNRELQKLVPLASSFHKGISPERIAELKEKALDQLIERAYMVQYALSEEIAVSREEIDAVYQPVRDRFQSKEDFKQALGQESADDLRASIYRMLLADKALEAAVTNKVTVTESDIRTYYDDNKERFMRPRQFRASHILIKVDPSASSEQRAERLQKARELVEKARSGEDFYNLAYYNSDDRTKFVGGDLGYFHQGQMIAEIDEAVQDMKVGEISDPVQTLYGYSIIKLVEDNPPRQLSFAEMKDKLLEERREREFAELKSAWLEMLKEKYEVERFPQ